MHPDSNFKINDFGEDAVNDVIERLKTKRMMSNKEILYLKGLIQRAVDHGKVSNSSVFNVLVQEELKMNSVVPRSKLTSLRCKG